MSRTIALHIGGKSFTEGIPGLEDELADYLHIGGIGGRDDFFFNKPETDATHDQLRKVNTMFTWKPKGKWLLCIYISY